MTAGAVAPIGDPALWFGILVSSLLLSLASLLIGRAFPPGSFNRLFHWVWLAIALASLVVLCCITVVRLVKG